MEGAHSQPAQPESERLRQDLAIRSSTPVKADRAPWNYN
jgi:hypothetical protein